MKKLSVKYWKVTIPFFNNSLNSLIVILLIILYIKLYNIYNYLNYLCYKLFFEYPFLGSFDI